MPWANSNAFGISLAGIIWTKARLGACFKFLQCLFLVVFGGFFPLFAIRGFSALLTLLYLSRMPLLDLKKKAVTSKNQLQE
jgi:hypothetical protein